MKKYRILLLITLVISLLFATHSYARHDVKPTKIKRVGKATVTVNAGQEFELKVKMTPLKAEDDFLRWKIVKGSNVVRFEDDDRTDDEIELKALKAGTAKIRCQIKGTSKKVDFTVKVKKIKEQEKKISAKGSLNRTVEAGDDFDLEVKKYSGLKNKNLKWTIKNTSILRFEENDNKGKEVELYARKTGKTTVTCTNTLTKQKIKFTITVVPDYDDDRDDD